MTILSDTIGRLRKSEAQSCAGAIVINDVVYAESSIRYDSVPVFQEALAGMGVELAAIPYPALFPAGKAFRQYRQVKGAKTGVLPDFFIGAHAVVSRLPLLTRDALRYRKYFPTIELIAPDIR